MTTTKDIFGESDVTKTGPKTGDKLLKVEILGNISCSGGLLEYPVT